MNLRIRPYGDLFGIYGTVRRRKFISYTISMIDLTKYKSLWKTKKSLEEEKDKELWIEIIRIYWPKTWKPVAKITRRDLADRVFSEYCRLYYADDEWYVSCITSGVRMFWTESQCWHFISRGTLKYRYDINNCYPQSYAENCILSGNYKVYTIKMIQMHWIKKVEEMINDKQLVKLSQNWFEENIIERYHFIQEKKMIIENWITKE